MTHTTSQNLVDLTVATLTQETRCEIARSLADCRPNEGPCAFELFRRAIVQHDQDAWPAIYNLYHGFIITWISQRLPASHADAYETLVDDTFVKFFRAVDARRFEGFSSAPRRLAYLRTCACSVAADYLRSQRVYQVKEPLVESFQEVVLDDPAEEVMMQLFASKVWQAIGKWVNEEERLVLQGICILGWPAYTLQHLSPTQFPTAEDVYRIKGDVLERLRRNRQLVARSIKHATGLR